MSPIKSHDPDDSRTPENIFADWAVCAENGDVQPIGELLAANAKHASALQGLYEDWKLFAPILGKVVPGLIASDLGIHVPPFSRTAYEDDEAPSPDLLDRLGIHASNEGRYRFRAVIGRGGGGVVLKVWDTKLNRPLAMKVVLGRGEERPTGDTPRVGGRTLARFVDEARIASQLNHPGIVPIHELGADDTGRAFFTMKLVRGENLGIIFDHVKSGHDGWNRTRALGVLLRVCEAMSFAHDKSVIHRDLKPANVMVGRYGEVYVMDWGLARVLGEKDSRDVPSTLRDRSDAIRVDTIRSQERDSTPNSPLVTLDGTALGTPMYMAPEQARNESELVGPRADVYAIGAMLYELLSGQPPYVPPGSRLSALAVYQLALDGPPKKLESLAPRAPQELVSICNKAMSREQSSRYATTQALSEDLRAFLERRVVAAYETGTWAETKKWVQRNKPLAASTVAALAIAIAAVVWISVINVELVSAKELADNKTKEVISASQRAAEKEREALIAQEDLKGTTANLEIERAKVSQVEKDARAQAQLVVDHAAKAGTLKQLAVDNAMKAEAAQASLAQAQQELIAARQDLDGAQSALSTYTAEVAVTLQDRIDAQRMRILSKSVAQFEGLDDDSEHAMNASGPVAQWWMRQARQLVEGQVEDPATQQPSIPGMRDVERLIVGLRTRARNAGLRPDKPAVATNPEIERLKLELQWMLRMLGVEPWPQPSPLETDLSAEHLPTDSDGLRVLAIELVGESSEIYGREHRGLALARLAVQAARNSQERKKSAAVLGWAMFRCGQLEDALLEARKPLEDVNDMPIHTSRLQLGKRVGRWVGDVERSRREGDISELRSKIADWEKDPTQVREGIGSSVNLALGTAIVLEQDQYWHEELMALYRRLERLKKRIKQTDQTIVYQEHERLWHEAVQAVARSDGYRGAKWATDGGFGPQLGLIPIGPDPKSGLWEFAHVESGDVPSRRGDGTLLIDPQSAIVLVLLPGGQVPTSENKDRRDYSPSPPLTSVTLSPFFLSKNKITPAQWKRLGGWQAPVRMRRNIMPFVVGLSARDCQTTLREVGWLALPTEAQLEYGRRAGSAATWCCLNTEHSAKARSGELNLHGPESSVECVDLKGPNRFGIHELFEDFDELCRDSDECELLESLRDARRSRDGLLYRDGIRIGTAYCAHKPDDSELIRLSSHKGQDTDTRNADMTFRVARPVLP